MLYNKSTGKPQADLLSLDSLIEWLEQQPADGTYMYCSARQCLLAQYFTAKGLENVTVTPYVFKHGQHEGFRDSEFLPKGWEDLATGPVLQQLEQKWTFGEALKRAKALQKKQGRAA